MKKKQYLYAISFWFTDQDGKQGQSCVQILRSAKIKSQSAFGSVVDYIKERNNLSTVVICNIMLLGKEKFNGEAC